MWTAILAFIELLRSVGPGVAKSIIGNKEARDEAQAKLETAKATAEQARFEAYGVEDAERQKAYAKEFRETGRTWFDVFVDGINRLCRPTFTFGTLAWFVYAVIDPEQFNRSAVALQAMPQEGWILASGITSFWFTSRVFEKIAARSAAPAVADVAVKELDVDDAPRNKTIAEWRQLAS